jgi:hypothetical protein
LDLNLRKRCPSMIDSRLDQGLALSWASKYRLHRSLVRPQYFGATDARLPRTDARRNPVTHRTESRSTPNRPARTFTEEGRMATVRQDPAGAAAGTDGHVTRRRSPQAAMFIGVGGQIGSGWLFAVLAAAGVAGPSAIISACS